MKCLPFTVIYNTCIIQHSPPRGQLLDRGAPFKNRGKFPANRNPNLEGFNYLAMTTCHERSTKASISLIKTLDVYLGYPSFPNSLGVKHIEGTNMEETDAPATPDKRRHFHHHHRRRIQGEPIEQIEGDRAAEPERRPKKEKRVCRSSLLVHTGHRNHRYHPDAGASRSGGNTSHPAQNTKQSLGRIDNHLLK